MNKLKHYWTIRVSILSHGFDAQGAPYTLSRHETLGVVTDTLEQAVTWINNEMPEATIWAVNHHGKVTYVS